VAIGLVVDDAIVVVENVTRLMEERGLSAREATPIAMREVTGPIIAISLVLMAVLMMRWNVVIGGQEIAKTGKGLLSYHPLIFHREGLVAAASVLVIPFGLLWVMIQLFPPWEKHAIPSTSPESVAR